MGVRLFYIIIIFLLTTQVVNYRPGIVPFTDYNPLDSYGRQSWISPFPNHIRLDS